MARILYIEDEPFLGSTLKNIFEKAGHTLEISPDGEAGIAELRKGGYQAVLLDLLLPKIDGFEVLKKIQDDPGLKSIPVIVLSNLGTDEDEKRTRDLGAAAHFVKAMMDPHELLAYVGQQVGT